jgi:hypothetical protein
MCAFAGTKFPNGDGPRPRSRCNRNLKIHSAAADSALIRPTTATGYRAVNGGPARRTQFTASWFAAGRRRRFFLNVAAAGDIAFSGGSSTNAIANTFRYHRRGLEAALIVFITGCHAMDLCRITNKG